MLKLQCFIKKALLTGAFFCACVLAGNAWAMGASTQAGPASAAKHQQGCAPLRIDTTARVAHVYDGDTLRLEDGRKVRFIGIDTPEVFSRKRELDPLEARLGEAAKRALREKLVAAGERVSLQYGMDTKDRYGRVLAHVFLVDGESIQGWLLANGYAIAYTTPPNDRLGDCYRRQEQSAREQQRGIWASRLYQSWRVSQLHEASRGFHIVQGRVTDIWQTKKRLTLQVDHRLHLHIYKSDLSGFSLPQLKALKGRQIEARGWLKSYRKKNSEQPAHSMILRHSSSLTEQK